MLFRSRFLHANRYPLRSKTLYHDVRTTRASVRDEAGESSGIPTTADDAIQRRYLRVSDAVRSWVSSNALSGETPGLGLRPRLNRLNWNLTTPIMASEASGLLFPGDRRDVWPRVLAIAPGDR